jgi:hypothetical protein
MATKQEVADFINATNTNTIWTAQEAAYVQGKLDPFFAQCLIKLVGDVSWLVEVRDNTARESTNKDGFS